MGRLGAVLVVAAARVVSAAPKPPYGHTGDFCEDVRVHDDNKVNEGYGNHLHAVILAAELAEACNLTLVIPNTGRMGHICSRLGCEAGFIERRNFGSNPKPDFEVVYQPGYGARCLAKKTRDCRFRVPGGERCLLRAQADATLKTRAIRKVLDVSRPRAAATCDDGSAASDFDVAIHFRAITSNFEGRDEAIFRMDNKEMALHKANRDPPIVVDDKFVRMRPFEEVVAPVAAYIREAGYERKIFLAGNVPEAKRAIAARFREAGVVVCAVDAADGDLRHPSKNGNDVVDWRLDPTICDRCLDVTFSEWAYVARARELLVQLGMHCTGNGTCLDPRERIYGRRSSYSLTAATYAGVPSTIITEPEQGHGPGPLDPAKFTPPGYTPPSGLSLACNIKPVLQAFRGPPQN